MKGQSHTSDQFVYAIFVYAIPLDNGGYHVAHTLHQNVRLRFLLRYFGYEPNSLYYDT